MLKVFKLWNNGTETDYHRSGDSFLLFTFKQKYAIAAKYTSAMAV
jgi:hypothetical protein